MTIATYNGVQARARLAATYTTIDAYKKTFQIVSFENVFPTGNACLGPTSQYPSGCATGGQSASSRSDVNTMLSDAGLSEFPSLATQFKTLVYADNFYGAKVLLYDLPGTRVDCGASPVMSDNGSGVWGFWGARYSIDNGSGVFCAVGLE